MLSQFTLLSLSVASSAATSQTISHLLRPPSERNSSVVLFVLKNTLLSVCLFQSSLHPIPQAAVLAPSLLHLEGQERGRTSSSKGSLLWFYDSLSPRLIWSEAAVLQEQFWWRHTSDEGSTPTGPKLPHHPNQVTWSHRFSYCIM